MISLSKRRLRALMSRSLALLAAIACSATLASAATHDVAVVDHEYEPIVLTVAPGDTVVWTAFGAEHTVTAEDNSFDSSTELPTPSIPIAGTFSHTFNNLGEYGYYCQVHGGPNGIGMWGKIRVVDPNANNAPAKPANSAPTAGATNQSLSPTLTASAFSDPDAGDTHISSQWIIRKQGETAPFIDSGETTAEKTSFSAAGLTNSTVYSWQVRYKDSAGAWSDYSDATLFTTVSPVTAIGSGLTASYGPLKRGLGVVTNIQVDPKVDFDWRSGRPNKKTPSNNLYAKWEGTVLPESSETYLFRVKADGGVKLWVGGELVIDDWVNGRFAMHRSGTAVLQAGVPTSIILEYFDTTGQASVQLRWVSPNHALEVIPTENLFPLPAATAP